MIDACCGRRLIKIYTLLGICEFNSSSIELCYCLTSKEPKAYTYVDCSKNILKICVSNAY